MAKNFYSITLALAGICHCARLAQQLAHSGSCDSEHLHTAVYSLLQTQPISTLAVYGDRPLVLAMGLEILENFLHVHRQEMSIEIMRYVLGLISLERKLIKHPIVLQKLSKRISQVRAQFTDASITSHEALQSLAAIYIDIISPLGPRIQVTGTSTVLKNPLIQDKIRAVLLAGIRSAVLWQQVGGRRLHLFFFRKHILQQTRYLLDHHSS